MVGCYLVGKGIATPTRPGAIMKQFLLADEIHTADDPECPMCLEEYPESCDCGGLIHGAGQPGDDGEVIVATRCDRCGGNEDEAEVDVA